MYKITTILEVSSSHNLNLTYDSPCQNNHGHNWIVEIEVSGKELNPNGMLIDFTHIKKAVMVLDHKCINDIIGDLNPTAENMSKWIANQVNIHIEEAWREDAVNQAMAENPTSTKEEREEDVYEIVQLMEIPTVTRVTVQESRGNVACYTL